MDFTEIPNGVRDPYHPDQSPGLERPVVGPEGAILLYGSLGRRPRGFQRRQSFYKIILSSPTRRVTRCWSRYSSSGIAYFRVTPSRSLNVPTSILGDFVFCCTTSWRS